MSYFRRGNVQEVEQVPKVQKVYNLLNFLNFLHLLNVSTKICGQGWIRTTELRRGQIYSLLPLATWLLALEKILRN
jgi:hypothetical protein